MININRNAKYFVSQRLVDICLSDGFYLCKPDMPATMRTATLVCVPLTFKEPIR